MQRVRSLRRAERSWSRGRKQGICGLRHLLAFSLLSVLTVTEEFLLAKSSKFFNPYCAYFDPIVATMWSSCFELSFICDPSSIKAALFLYYTSVLISTKIISIFSLRDPSKPTERSYKIEGPRLSMGATYKLKPSPSAWPDSRNVRIPLGSTSYVSGFCIRFLYKSVLNTSQLSSNALRTMHIIGSW